MSNWLLKTEPNDYSWPDLVSDRRAEWDGVRNAAALKNLRAAKLGDQVLVYHTGKERCAVGVAKVVRAAYPDPGGDGERFVIDIAPVRPLARPVLLADMRANPKLEGFDLLRIGRLCVVPVSAAHWKEILRMSG